jgi:hypothetical protein
MKERQKHFAQHPYYLMGVSDEQQRIIFCVAQYLEMLETPSFSINKTVLYQIITGQQVAK